MRRLTPPKSLPRRAWCNGSASWRGEAWSKGGRPAVDPALKSHCMHFVEHACKRRALEEDRHVASLDCRSMPELRGVRRRAPPRPGNTGPRHDNPRHDGSGHRHRRQRPHHHLAARLLRRIPADQRARHDPAHPGLHLRTRRHRPARPVRRERQYPDRRPAPLDQIARARRHIAPHRRRGCDAH